MSYFCRTKYSIFFIFLPHYFNYLSKKVNKEGKRKGGGGGGCCLILMKSFYIASVLLEGIFIVAK